MFGKAWVKQHSLVNLIRIDYCLPSSRQVETSILYESQSDSPAQKEERREVSLRETQILPVFLIFNLFLIVKQYVIT